jgi:hypothetical protein
VRVRGLAGAGAGGLVWGDAGGRDMGRSSSLVDVREGLWRRG